MKYQLPVVKDVPDTRDHLVAPPAIVLASNASMLPYLGSVKDQGSLGSCTAHAGTSLREFLYRRFYQWEKNKAVLAANFRLSPLFQYAMERTIEGDFSQDYGADSRTIFKAMSTYGCCLEGDDPYLTGDFKIEPTADQFAKALPYRSISYHRAPDVATLKSVLASGYCATVGLPLYPAFESDAVAATGRVPVPTSTETSIGGHEMLVFGYSDAMGCILVRNSWGAGWGDSGNCFIPYAYFDAPGVMDETDFWTAHLGKPW